MNKINNMAALRQRPAEPALKVEILVSCTDLADKDVTSHSDPCCVLHMQSGTHWSEIGRTENVKNTLSPQFAKTFELDYYFEQVQKLRFRIYDLDNKTTTLSDDDFLGELQCTLGEVVSGSPFSRKLLKKNGKHIGKSLITLKANEVAKTQDVLTLTFKAQKLDKKDLMGKSDPFLELSRQGTDGSWQVVHRTEVIKNDLNPSWRPFLVKTSKLTVSGNYASPILVTCSDYDSDGSHDVIGTFTTSIEELMKASKTQLSWPCINTKKSHKKGYQNSGTVILTSCLVSKDYSFLDFIFGGLQINFTVAVDFTASNGNQRSSDSLHYFSPQYPNQYMLAIQGVGNVIQDYDSDQMFPALGFGAQIPPHQKLSHEFALNFNPGNPFCAGIRGVLDAYMHCLPQVVLYGPTNFSPVIRHVIKFAEVAKRESGAKNYFILLILTDGAISDIDATVESIVYASTLPMSIIIIGVGDADFTTMDMLDADNGKLKDRRGNVSSRDIVQFVPFEKKIQPADLARLVLAEVPRQVCDYYRDNRIIPGSGTKQTLSTGPAAQLPPAPGGAQGPGPCPPGSVPEQPGQYPAGQPGQYHPGQPGQYPPGQPQPGQYPPGQPGQYPPGQPGQYPPGQPGQYPPGQPGQYPPGQPGQYPPGQPGQYPPGQPGQYPPGQPGQYPPGQPGQYPSGQPGQYPSGQQGQYPPGQPGQYPSGQPGQYPPGQPGQYPPGQPGQYPGPPVQHPGQPGQYLPGQSSHYSPGHGQQGQYPGQSGQYPGQPGQYPGQPGQYPGQPGQYPGQPGQYPGQPGQYPTGQPSHPGVPASSSGPVSGP